MENKTYHHIRKYIKLHPVTSLLLFLNILMVIIVFIRGGFNTLLLLELGALHPYLVIDLKEYHRLIASMFLHGSIIHFLMNGLVLFYLGGFLERYLGYVKYLTVYMLSGVASSLAVVLLGPDAVTVGASGALYGVIGALFILITIKPNWFPPQTAKSIRGLIIINLILTIAIPGISVEGHLGGLIAGSFIILVFVPKLPYFIAKDPRYKELRKQQNDTFDA